MNLFCFTVCGDEWDNSEPLQDFTHERCGSVYIYPGKHWNNLDVVKRNISLYTLFLTCSCLTFHPSLRKYLHTFKLHTFGGIHFEVQLQVVLPFGKQMVHYHRCRLSKRFIFEAWRKNKKDMMSSLWGWQQLKGFVAPLQWSDEWCILRMWGRFPVVLRLRVHVCHVAGGGYEWEEGVVRWWLLEEPCVRWKWEGSGGGRNKELCKEEEDRSLYTTNRAPFPLQIVVLQMLVI